MTDKPLYGCVDTRKIVAGNIKPGLMVETINVSRAASIEAFLASRGVKPDRKAIWRKAQKIGWRCVAFYEEIGADGAVVLRTKATE
jgi:hypothetical protein